MDLRRLRPIFAPACFALVFLLLANNLALTQDPFPARSTHAPDINGQEVTHEVTFQVEPGARLHVNLLRAMLNHGVSELSAYDAYLLATPIGDPRPDIRQEDIIRSYHGTIEIERGFGRLTEHPPTWEVRAQSWLTLVLVMHHQTPLPQDEEARTLYVAMKHQALLDDGPFGPEAMPFQQIPASAMVLQPAFNALEALAALGILAGAAAHIRPRPAPAHGTEAALHLALSANNWLRTLQQLLLVVVIGTAATTLMAFFALGEGQLIIGEGLDPDGAYIGRMVAGLVFAVVAGLTGASVLIWRIQQARRNLPALDFDA